MVLADAYSDWSASKKTLFDVPSEQGKTYGFAGIYYRWKNPSTGEILVSSAIITTTANSLFQSIGVKCMPVILPIDYEKDWIKDTIPLA